MTVSYIVEIRTPSGNPYEETWMDTTQSLDEALKLAEGYQQKRDVIGVQVIEWTGDRPLKHHSHSQLNCGQASPRKVVYCQVRDYLPSSYSTGYNPMQPVGDWRTADGLSHASHKVYSPLELPRK